MRADPMRVPTAPYLPTLPRWLRYYHVTDLTTLLSKEILLKLSSSRKHRSSRADEFERHARHVPKCHGCVVIRLDFPVHVCMYVCMLPRVYVYRRGQIANSKQVCAWSGLYSRNDVDQVMCSPYFAVRNRVVGMIARKPNKK